MALLSHVAALASVLAAVAVPAPTSRAAETARRVEERHKNVRDLQARFVQTYRSRLLGREIVERGTVSIKSPGRMRWDYRDPEPKTFVSDGKTFYFYVPADKQVIVRDQGDTRGITAQLLAGRLEILEHFEVGTETFEGRERLRLTPRKADPELERVYLDLDGSYRIRGIEIVDPQGNESRFAFEDLRENVGIPDRLFKFDVPKGVEVISG